MICRDIDELLIVGGARLEFPGEAMAHIESCADCQKLVAATEIILPPTQVNEKLLGRIRQAIGATLTPVEPLAAERVFAVSFFAIFLMMAIAGGLLLGPAGFRALTVSQRVIVYAIVGFLGALAALALSRYMAPGRKNVPAALVAVTSIVAFEALFLAIFRDYATTHFLSAGLRCLLLGLGFAGLTAIASWQLARRGFILERGSTGMVLGVLAGLSGLGVLELHCPNLTVPHVVIWHGAVLLISAFAGWGLFQRK